MGPQDGVTALQSHDTGEWLIRDQDAREYVEHAATTVASLVRSTFGPRSMEKLILTRDPQDEPEIVQSGDANEILAAIERGDGFNHPVAALFVDSVDSMQRGLGDGTTTAMVLTGELVERGVDLVDQGLHPTAVTIGYAIAAGRAGELLDDLVRPCDDGDRELLTRVATTAMTGDLDEAVRQAYADRVAEAVEGLAATGEAGWIDTDDVKVVAEPGGEGALYRGLVVRRRPGALDKSERAKSEFDWTPAVREPMTDAGVALIDREIDFEYTATPLGGKGSAGVALESTDQLAAYTTGLDRRIETTVARVRELGVDVLVSRPEVDDAIRESFERAGVAVVDDVKLPNSDVYRLARATGGEVVSHLDDITPERVGTAGSVVERRVGDEKWAMFENCDGPVFTMVLGCQTDSERARHERIVEDALEVASIAARDGQVLPGAGAPAMAVAVGLRDYAADVPGKERLAVEAFADALEELVYALAENAGLDPIDARSQLRAAHAATDPPASLGLDLASGEPIDAWDAAIVEPRRVFSQAVETATSTAEELLTVDAVAFPNVDLRTYTPRHEHD